MFSEEIVIDGIIYNCMSQCIGKFNIVASISEAKNILEIYETRREIPIYFRGANKTTVILNVIEQTYSRNDDEIIILLEIA